jgi:hypothetical protein
MSVGRTFSTSYHIFDWLQIILLLLIGRACTFAELDEPWKQVIDGNARDFKSKFDQIPHKTRQCDHTCTASAISTHLSP